MTTLILHALLVLLLSIVLWQDFAYRAVSWILFLGIVSLLLLKSHLFGCFSEEMYGYLLNLLILAIQIVMLGGYFTIKWMIQSGGKKFELPLGLGDLCLWVVAAFGFSPLVFTFFFTGSLFFSLMGHLAGRAFFSRYYQSTVPLAGWQAFCWIVCVITSHFNLSWLVNPWEMNPLEFLSA